MVNITIKCHVMFIAIKTPPKWGPVYAKYHCTSGVDRVTANGSLRKSCLREVVQEKLLLWRAPMKCPFPLFLHGEETWAYNTDCYFFDEFKEELKSMIQSLIQIDFSSGGGSKGIKSNLHMQICLIVQASPVVDWRWIPWVTSLCSLLRIEP